MALMGSSSSTDRKSTRLNSSHLGISYAVFCLKKKKNFKQKTQTSYTHHSLPLTLSQRVSSAVADVRLSARLTPIAIAPSLSTFFFFFNDTATTEIYTLSLHDAFPISRHLPVRASRRAAPPEHQAAF